MRTHTHIHTHGSSLLETKSSGYWFACVHVWVVKQYILLNSARMTHLSHDQIWHRKPKTWQRSCTSLLAEDMCCTPGPKTCQIFEVAVGVLARNYIRLYMSASGWSCTRGPRQPHVWERVNFNGRNLPKNPLKWLCNGLCVFPTAYNSLESFHTFLISLTKAREIKAESVDFPFKPVYQSRHLCLVPKT